VPGCDLPYLYHVGAVVIELLAAHAKLPIDNINLAVMCSALHDCMEDQGVSADTLRLEFGPQVAAGVEALSKDATLPKDKAMADSLQRIRRQPKAVWCVKLADRIANLALPPAHWSSEKVAAYRAEAGLILDALGQAHAPLAATLEEKIRLYPPAS
jgi:GTP diphosphokinase / guanosine-3',5'-bis(diphosphate) 3'-diphosphatase